MSLFPPTVQRAMAVSGVARQHTFAMWPGGLRHQCSDPDSIYHGYPYLFLDAFPSLALAEVEPLARGAGLIFDSVIIADRIMDDETEHVTEDILGVEVMQFEGYRLLGSLFPVEEPFWDRFREYMVAYTQACLRERKLAHQGASWKGLTESVAVSIAVGKCGIAKIAVAGLASLAHDDAAYTLLIQAVEQYYAARQMLDDLSDWREDLDRGFPSLLLSRVVAAAFDGDREQMRLQRERTRREIYYGGHVRHTMELALAAIAESDRLTSDYPDLLWRRQTAAVRDRCAAVLKQVEHPDSRLTVTRRLALSLPAPASFWQEVAWSALKRLLLRWGATAAAPAAAVREGVTSKVGDVLPLALVADALCDIDPLLDAQLQPLIQSLADYLIYRRRPDGGWSYSAVSLDLPPDTDHLGLVVRTLLRAERQADVDQHCSGVLSCLLDSGMFRDDGSVETWIRRRPEDSVPSTCEPDPAITAQMLEALVLYDADRFGEPIRRGLSWLESCQLSDGSWRSGHYRGPFYATAACLRLVAALRPDSPAVPRAASFLRKLRRDDGGWGHESARSDGISTSLALQGLALAQNGRADADDFEQARRTFHVLLQMEGGGDLTTAFILKAAVLWHGLAVGSAGCVGSV